MVILSFLLNSYHFQTENNNSVYFFSFRLEIPQTKLCIFLFFPPYYIFLFFKTKPNGYFASFSIIKEKNASKKDLIASL